jgi:hypothetical protein
MLPEDHLIERLASTWFRCLRLFMAVERIAEGKSHIKVEFLGTPRMAFASSGSCMEAMHEPIPSSQAASCILAAACPRSKPSATEEIRATAKGAPAR